MRNKHSSKKSSPPSAASRRSSQPSSTPAAVKSGVAAPSAQSPADPAGSCAMAPIRAVSASALVPIASAPVRDSSKVIPSSSDLSSSRPDLAISGRPAADAVKTADPAILTRASTTTYTPWVSLFKGTSRRLEKKGTTFTLPSGEACVKIPNSVIEKNRKAWDCFIIGLFYSDPPAQGTIHSIVNGIWSRFQRDISVSKLEGNAFLFRIPNSSTRYRVLSQGLWQIEGQTMFVAKWDPGLIPKKPELTSAPVWLELRNVPHQFFNEDGFEFIAGLVGEPKGLHPSTANLTNLEVAKVFTLIDPRKPLPEAVNVQFDSGEICRVLVSSPWMPPVCSFCKEVGHTLKRCKLAPISCSGCNSTCHSNDDCPRAKANSKKKNKFKKKFNEVSPKAPFTPQ